MKAADLQTGDLVWLSDDICVKVEQITKKKVGYHVKENECKMHYARLCDIEPIPITPEILEKNGIVKHDNHSFYEYSDCKQRIRVLIPKSQRPFLDVNNDCECNVMMNFEYVHELQHALRLCKIDKEIEL